MDTFVFENLTGEIIEYIEERLGIKIDSIKKQFLIDNYKDEFNNPIDKTAEFNFTAKSFRCDQVESDTIEIGENIEAIAPCSMTSS